MSLCSIFRILLKEREAELEAIAHQKEEAEQDTHVIAAESSGCGRTCGCGQLRSELDAALLKLNEKGCAKYGDLLRENFTLTQKVTTPPPPPTKGDPPLTKLPNLIPSNITGYTVVTGMPK